MVAQNVCQVNTEFFDANKKKTSQRWVIESGYQDVEFLIIGKYKNNVKEIKQIKGRSTYIQLEIQIKIVDIVMCMLQMLLLKSMNFFTKVFENIPKSDELIVHGDFITSLSPTE